ncbi:class I fructose-bisphosphate aldolase [Megamonas hypermegale]|uniref:class I fructose-bisphosphate aldolase n=1 Tax=Megamonas hypermegale TaxID=158847 RepID=UPI0026EC6D33|nr:fructose-bisphosphate aldolase [Megamonas hypermegale]
MAMLGKKVRMSRLINPKSDKMMAITVDHSISRGIMQGLIPIQDTIDKIVAGGPEAITMTKGIAEICFPQHAGKCSLLLKCSSYSPVQSTCDAYFGDAEEGVRMGADGVSVGAIVLGDHQAEQLINMGKMSKQCMSLGMPLIGHIYPKGESVKAEDRTKWENIAYAVRAGAELGVDIIKTTYTGDPKTMAKVVEACPARVAIQGGDSCHTIEDYMNMTYDAINKAGVGGVVFGRFVWSYPDITSLVKSLGSIIHDGATPKQALEMLHDLESDNAKK